MPSLLYCGVHKSIRDRVDTDGARVEVVGGSDLELVVIDCAPEAVLVDDREVALGPGGEDDGLEVREHHVLEVLDALEAKVCVEELLTGPELEDVPEGGEVLVVWR
jgi:hypothetical protein